MSIKITRAEDPKLEAIEIVDGDGDSLRITNTYTSNNLAIINSTRGTGDQNVPVHLTREDAQELIMALQDVLDRGWA